MMAKSISKRSDQPRTSAKQMAKGKAPANLAFRTTGIRSMGKSPKGKKPGRA
jgi:hypothetical protein